MNVLPIVSAFILLFAIGSYTFIHQFRAAVQEKYHYTSSMKIQREYGRYLQSKRYQIYTGKNLHPNESTGENKDEEAEYKSHRDRLNPFPESKLNISLLFKEENHPHIEAITRNLIRRLYVRTNLYFSEMESIVLDHIITAIRKNPKITTFEALILELPEETYPLFYKLLKGTQTYSLSTNVGYPSLADYISLDPEERKKPIQFTYASRTLLQALFDDRIANLICLEEKHKWEEKHKPKPLKKQELEMLLSNNRKNLSTYEPLLYFSTKRHSAPTCNFFDKVTKYGLKIKK